MSLWNKQKIVRWLRFLHRDLGFLMVGISLVYAISGIILNHMGGKDPAYKTETGTVQLAKNLEQKDLVADWNKQSGLPSVKRTFSIDNEHSRLMLEGGVGVYNKQTGLVDYETFKQRKFVYWINRLHYNKVGGWSYMADFFAGTLIFLAISGLFMVKGKYGIVRRGKWWLIAGLLIPVLYILLS